jgi:hypothetical protein
MCPAGKKSPTLGCEHCSKPSPALIAIQGWPTRSQVSTDHQLIKLDSMTVIVEACPVCLLPHRVRVSTSEGLQWTSLALSLTGAVPSGKAGEGAGEAVFETQYTSRLRPG